MYAERDEAILKHLRVEDLPEGCEVIADYLTIDIDEIKAMSFYKGDGLDLLRYVVKCFSGLQFRIPRLTTLKLTMQDYIASRMRDEPKPSIKRLSKETGLDEKTVREYLKRAE